MTTSELNEPLKIKEKYQIQFMHLNMGYFFIRLLTLPSGWRIQFGDNVNFIFETHDLIHASPATISRMGIVNLR